MSLAPLPGTSGQGSIRLPFPLLICEVLRTFACQASTRLLNSVSNRIFGCVGMALGTMGFQRSSHVLRMGYGFEMFRVNAMSDTAEVVEFSISWNRANTNLISEAVSRIPLLIHLEDAIPEAAKPALPKPTRVGLLDLGPETFLMRRHDGVKLAIPPPTKIVFIAPSTRLMGGTASRNCAVGMMNTHREPILSGVTGRAARTASPHHFTANQEHWA